ncbi:MAG TPA: lipopolysaccharide heptosyltransferase I [Methylomirabilota bacterium]|nr:lipopolysaccharide heptosyltransferase I [Methylomirabilota bacterium]
MAADGARVAIVKLSSLGDVVHALPVAAALRAARPHARLTWVAERREAAVLHGHPALDEVVAVDTRRWRRARRPREVAAAVREMAALRAGLRGRFDVALDLQGLLKSGLLAAATGAPLRIGFAAARCREPLSALLTNRRVTPPATARHAVDHCLALLEPLGVSPGRVEFHVPRAPAAEARMEEFFAAAGLKPRTRVVVLNPGAGHPAKRWPVERFRELGGRLVQEVGASVLVAWGPGERAAALAIAGDAGPGGPGPVLAPPTGLDDLVALLARASVVVAGDTGPLHVAAALGVPCVGLYGPTAAARNGPYGPGHHALQSPDGTLAALGVDAVLHAVGEALG